MKDLIGKKFGTLLVIEKCEDRASNGCIRYVCFCEYCNTKTKPIRSDYLKNDKSFLCGHGHVKHRNEKHGMRNSCEYTVWKNMKQRCHNSDRENYKDYGGRGIFVARRWRNSFINFYKDMGPRPDGMSIDRILNNDSYGKWNCRWATPKQQANNRRKGK